MKEPIQLNSNERIIAVIPERCSGSGWSNTPIWVYIENKVNGTLRTECLQPAEQTITQKILFDVCLHAHEAMLYATEKLVRREK